MNKLDRALKELKISRDRLDPASRSNRWGSPVLVGAVKKDHAKMHHDRSYALQLLSGLEVMPFPRSEADTRD